MMTLRKNKLPQKLNCHDDGTGKVYFLFADEPKIHCIGYGLSEPLHTPSEKVIDIDSFGESIGALYARAEAMMRCGGEVETIINEEENEPKGLKLRSIFPSFKTSLVKLKTDEPVPSATVSSEKTCFAEDKISNIFDIIFAAISCIPAIYILLKF